MKTTLPTKTHKAALKHSPIYEKFVLHQQIMHLTKMRTFMQLITLNNKHTCMSNQDFHSANLECKQLILKFVVVLDPFFSLCYQSIN
jgi:hypothetical protein